MLRSGGLLEARRLCPSVLFAAVLAAFTLPSALTGQAPFVGPRAAAMAGAATAVADDGTAVWSNPAGLARGERFDLEILAGGVATNRNGFTALVDRLSSLDLSAIRAGQDPGLLQRAIRDLQLLAAPGTGVVGSGVAGAVFGTGSLAVAIGDLAYAGASPTVDLVRVLPGSDPNTGFAFNRTGISFAGLEAREVRLSYAQSFLAKVLLVGGTVRYIRGRTYFVRVGIFDVRDSDPATLARDALKRNARETGRFAFDVGAMVNVVGKARVGLVSTAINEPEFPVSSDPAAPGLAGAPSSLRLPRTLRAGVAAQPIGMITVAADYDLRQTDTLLPGGGSRQLALGMELKLPLFAIRGGAFRDRAAPDPHWAYSAGFGVGLKALSVNAAVVFSSEGGLSLSSTNRRDVGAAVDARVRF